MIEVLEFIGQILLAVVLAIGIVIYWLVCGVGWSFYYLVNPHPDYGQHLF